MIFNKNSRIGVLFFTVQCIIMNSLFLFPLDLQAKVTGTIVGRVVDESTGDYLPGANVFLRGTTFGSATDRRGEFRIENIQPGSYTLVVDYIGYEEYSITVPVTLEKVIHLDISLKASYIEFEEIVVLGLRQGQSKALSRQRSAPNITNIVDREQMEKFPDMNTAEVLQRISGVNIQRSFGEGKFVFLRGTEPRFTTITINGEKIATPEDEERYVALNVISANQLAAIDVIKAITPDMDGDAIGGVVNLVTRSAFDHEDQVIRANLGSGYNNLSGKPIYKSSVTYSNRFGEKRNLGLSISANWQQNNRVTHNNEMDWGNVEDVNGIEIPFALQDLKLRNYFNEHTCYGFNGLFEYRLNETNRFYIGGIYNLRDDVQERNELRVRFNKGDYEDATHVVKGRLVRELQHRLESQTITAFNCGGVHIFNMIGVDYNFSFSFADQEKTSPGQIIPEFELNKKVNLNMDLTKKDTPKYLITNLEKNYQNDPRNWKLQGIDYREEFTSDQDHAGTLNIRYPFTIGRYTADLKVGGILRFKQKDRDDQRWSYKWDGENDVLFDQFISNTTIDKFLNNEYSFGATTDPNKIRDFFKAHRYDSLAGKVKYDDAIGDKYKAGENIGAYYAMGTININKLMILAGIRHEFTRTNYTGTKLEFDEDDNFLRATSLVNKKTYSNLFPNMHLRYLLSSMTNLRFAFTSGISRPNYFDLVPYLWIIPSDQEIYRGNPDLNPTSAYNIDLMGEHYFQGVGIFSAGIFYKMMDNIIYPRVWKENGGIWDGYEIEQPINGGSADLYGYEINWQQQFTFLPGFLSGFGVYANYTFTQSKAKLEYREWSVLPGQAADAGNLALSYEKYGLTGRISVNYSGKFISEVGKSPDYDEYIDDHFQLDFSMAVRVLSGLEFYFEMINITNEPFYKYMGRRDRAIQRELYSWWMHSGLKYAF